MSLIMSRKVLLLTLIVLSIAAIAASQTGPRKKPHKAKAPVVQPAPEPAPTLAPPPQQLTPEQGPSSPPEVSFQGGQLTIVARNSTMSDVLTAVKQRTGAAVDMPVVSSERVVGRFGPGTPRDVMAQLLNGSHYDYVLVGSPADPGSLKKVVLVARINGPEPAAQPQQNQPARRGNANLQAVPDVANDDQQQEDNSAAEAPEAQEQPEQEEPQPEQPQQPSPNGPMVKTPEQLLRELQQQQQQQQQQNGTPPGAPPQ
jgi:cytoskeletal protein RodZ